MEPMLSAYELERLATIESNNAKLKELGLEPGGNAALPSQSSLVLASKKRRPVAGVVAPLRRSSRVRHEAALDIQVDEEKENGRLHVGGKDRARFVSNEAEDEGERQICLDDLPADVHMLLAHERCVYEVLRAARNEKAKSMQRSMFIVCNDRTLCEMVRTLPTSLSELVELYGMGSKKVAAHGELLLSTLAPHISDLKAEHAAWKRENANTHESTE